MIICVKSFSNFMCISSSVSHELCGHAKGQERNLSTLFGRTRRLRWGKLFWRRHLILHFCKTYIFATFMRKCQVWWVKEWLFVLYQRNIYFWKVEFLMFPHFWILIPKYVVWAWSGRLRVKIFGPMELEFQAIFLIRCLLQS